jgi:nuclear pore complex protein Nup160
MAIMIIGRYHMLCQEDQRALKSILNLDSEFAYYKHVAFVVFKDSWIHYKVTFSQLAVSVAPPDEDTTDLWNAVIDGHIALAQYDEAYCALVSAPPNPSCVQ